MPGWSLITGFFGNIISGYQKRKGKEADAKAAWENAAGRSMENGWKDEYVTVVITFPLWQIFIGNLWAAITGNTTILVANKAALADIGLLMATPYGEIMMIVVLAAVGIKGLKALR